MLTYLQCCISNAMAPIYLRPVSGTESALLKVTFNVLQELFDAVPIGDAAVRGARSSRISPAANLGAAQDEGHRDGQGL